MPLSNKRLLCNRRPAPLMTIYSKTIGFSKKEQDHSIKSVSCLINKGFCILGLFNVKFEVGVD